LARVRPTSRPPHDRISPFVRVICLCIILGGAYPAALPAQQDDLGNLVFSLAEAIIDSSKASTRKPVVRVYDFRDLHGNINELGVVLADQVSQSLNEASKTPTRTFFQVQDRISRTSASYDDQACDEKHPWPDILVTGDLDELAGNLTLRVAATPAGSHRPIFERLITLPESAAVAASFAKQLPQAGLPSTWVRLGYVPNADEEAKAARVDPKVKGFTVPSCDYCPRADYSDAAMKAKIQGIVTLKVLFGKQGEALKITVLDGLPCGMNQKAVETVANWQLHPAKAPDGTPVAVWQEVEITFQLY
jgi:TonB family protein